MSERGIMDLKVKGKIRYKGREREREREWVKVSQLARKRWNVL